MEPTQTDLTQAPQPLPGAIVMPEAAQAAILSGEDAASEQTGSSLSPDSAQDSEVDLTGTDDEDSTNSSDEPAFQWQASEYVQHNKGLGWYLTLGGIVLALLAIAIFTQQWLSIAVFVVMAAAVVVYAHKPPRVLLYQLDAKGILIEGKAYAYSQFRSFGVLPDLSWHTIDLEPTQRFMPRLTIIFDDEDFDSIVDHLSFHLPRVDRQPDLVERLTRFTRF